MLVYQRVPIAPIRQRDLAREVSRAFSPWSPLTKKVANGRLPVIRI